MPADDARGGTDMLLIDRARWPLLENMEQGGEAGGMVGGFARHVTHFRHFATRTQFALYVIMEHDPRGLCGRREAKYRWRERALRRRAGRDGQELPQALSIGCDASPCPSGT